MATRETGSRVHEALGGAQRADVRLEDRIVAPPHRAIRPGWNRAHDLRLDVTRLLGNLRAREDLARRSVPAKAEVVRDVSYRRPFDAHGRVVPADPSPRDVRRGVPGIAAIEGQVDAADERNAAVDHDRLLVMAVSESRAAVGVRLDLRIAGHVVEHVADVVLRRLEERYGRALPGEQPHVDLLSELGQEVPDDHRLVFS